MSAPHDDIIAAFLRVLRPRGGELRLLARLCDPLIDSRTDDAFVLVPDLHFLSPKVQARYGAYGFNYAESEVLYALLAELVPLREAWDDDGIRQLVTVQLGDFLDLWREVGPSEPIWSIPDDTQGRLRDVLYRGVHRGEPCLEATMLLGNHDTQSGIPLSEIPFQLKAFNRSADGRPFLFTTHGDAFDLLQILMPDPMKEFVVHVLGELTPYSTYTIEQWGRAAERTNRPAQAMTDAITQADHDLVLVEGALRVTPGASLPTHAVQWVEPTEGGHKFHEYHRALSSPGASASASGITVIAAGHTHQAAMLLATPPDAPPLLLMDVGAWVERCTYALAEGDTVTEPSAQIGVVHGNDARIYQVRFV